MRLAAGLVLALALLVAPAATAAPNPADLEAELVAQFGDGVLASPPKRGFDLLAWLLPLGGLALGVVVVGGLAWSWRRRSRADAAAPSEEPLDPALERRLDDELARFEG